MQWQKKYSYAFLPLQACFQKIFCNFQYELVQGEYFFSNNNLLT